MGELQRILYGEDDDDIREITELALTVVAGFTVCACSSGAEALEAAAAFMPDLVLLDVMMPGMDGPATLSALRRDPAFASTPVVFLTAKVNEGAFADYGTLDLAGTIKKPFDPVTLGAELREMWTTYSD